MWQLLVLLGWASRVHAQKFMYLVGLTGSGKSTIVHAMCGDRNHVAAPLAADFEQVECTNDSWTLIDTPGLDNVELAPTTVMEQLIQRIRTQPGLVIMVHSRNSRLAQHDLMYYAIWKKLIGNQTPLRLLVNNLKPGDHLLQIGDEFSYETNTPYGHYSGLTFSPNQQLNMSEIQTLKALMFKHKFPPLQLTELRTPQELHAMNNLSVGVYRKKYPHVRLDVVSYRINRLQTLERLIEDHQRHHPRVLWSRVVQEAIRVLTFERVPLPKRLTEVAQIQDGIALAYKRINFSPEDVRDVVSVFEEKQLWTRLFQLEPDFADPPVAVEDQLDDEAPQPGRVGPASLANQRSAPHALCASLLAFVVIGRYER